MKSLQNYRTFIELNVPNVMRMFHLLIVITNVPNSSKMKLVMINVLYCLRMFQKLFMINVLYCLRMFQKLVMINVLYCLRMFQKLVMINVLYCLRMFQKLVMISLRYTMVVHVYVAIMYECQRVHYRTYTCTNHGISDLYHYNQHMSSSS